MRRFLVVSVLVSALTAPALAAPVDDVKNALIGFGRLTSYHMTMDVGGQHMEGDVVVPGKMHLMMGEMEMVHIGSNTWMKVQGHWMQIPGGAGQGPGFTGALSHAQTLSAHSSDVTVTDLGVKSVDGESLHAYGVKNPGDPQPSTIYVGGDGHVHRIDSVDDKGKVSTIRFSRFNVPVAIDPPQ
jgi:hypothetical protein